MESGPVPSAMPGRSCRGPSTGWPKGQQGHHESWQWTPCCYGSSPFLHSPWLSRPAHLLIHSIGLTLSRPSSQWVLVGEEDPRVQSPCAWWGLATPDHPPFLDIDKVMINLKTEEFVLDMNTLQALQQLLQWVGDFVLYLLASLPNQVCPLPAPLQNPHSRTHEGPRMWHTFKYIV